MQKIRRALSVLLGGAVLVVFVSATRGGTGLAAEPAKDRGEKSAVRPALEDQDEADGSEVDAESAAQDLRSMLRGDDAGALSNPLKLQDIRTVARVCGDLQDPRAVELGGNVFRRGEMRHERTQERRRALARVYAVTVPGGSFRIQEYKYAKHLLPLDLAKGMSTFQGALSLQVMKREGSTFEIEPAAMKVLAGKLGRDQVSLRIGFRPADDEHPACFAYPKSNAFNLRLEPLWFELVADQDGAVLARAETRDLGRLRKWVSPAEGHLSLRVVGARDAQTEHAVALSLHQADAAFQACVKDVLQSSVDTIASFELEPSGGPSSKVRVDMEDARHKDAIECLRAALSKTTLPRTAKGSSVQVVFAVEREDQASEASPDEVKEPEAAKDSSRSDARAPNAKSIAAPQDSTKTK